MNNLADNLGDQIYDYSIGDNNLWQSKLKNVINHITYCNVDDIVCKYFSNNHMKAKDLDISIINCLFFP